MSRTTSGALALLVSFGCGASRTAAPSANPDCTTVAAHLVELAERDNGGAASATLAADLRAELERSCRDGNWSAERRGCLMGAQDQEATLDCPVE